MVIKRIYNEITDKRLLAPNYLSIRGPNLMVEFDNGDVVDITTVKTYLLP